LDSQVKLRGHRVELEEIETRLASCDGVREAACRLQEAGATHLLVAFVVPAMGDSRWAMGDGRESMEDELRRLLSATLPAHMVPARIATLSALPTTPGGKLDRRALPTIDVDVIRDGDSVAPRNVVEARIAAAFAEVLRLKASPSVTADFFHDLDGDSLSAALAVGILQDDPATAALTVRDLYDHPSAADLAAFSQKADSPSVPRRPSPTARPPSPTPRPSRPAPPNGRGF